MSLDKFPPAQDPIWADWAAGVYGFLEEPRTWGAIRIWAKEHRISMDRMRNILAWLSLNNKAATIQMHLGRRVSIAWIAMAGLKSS
jgi:hypothetical protein